MSLSALREKDSNPATTAPTQEGVETRTPTIAHAQLRQGEMHSNPETTAHAQEESETSAASIVHGLANNLATELNNEAELTQLPVQTRQFDETLATNDSSNTLPIQQPAPTLLEHINAIKRGEKPTLELHVHPEIIKMQKKFCEKQFSHKMKHCHFCHERWYDAKGAVDEHGFF